MPRELPMSFAEKDASDALWRQRLFKAVNSERERCAKVAETFEDYTGVGHEDENSLIGMFARGNRSARRKIAAQIRDTRGK